MCHYTTSRALRAVIKYKHRVFELPKTDNYTQSVILSLEASRRQTLVCNSRYHADTIILRR